MGRKAANSLAGDVSLSNMGALVPICNLEAKDCERAPLRALAESAPCCYTGRIAALIPRKVAAFERRLMELPLACRSTRMPIDDDILYYSRLETGARYLAANAVDDDERREHLGMANRYSRLVLDAGSRKA